MADKYKSFYLTDLVPLIEHCALDLMTSPVIAGKKQDGTIMNLTEIANQNSMNAMYNDGVRDFARAVIRELNGPEDDSDE